MRLALPFCSVSKCMWSGPESRNMLCRVKYMRKKVIIWEVVCLKRGQREIEEYASWNSWWQFMMTIHDDNSWWQFFMKIFRVFGKFQMFGKFSDFLKILWPDTLHLRHWLHCWQLRTTVLTITLWPLNKEWRNSCDVWRCGQLYGWNCN